LLERRSAIAPVDPGWLARCREWKERYPVILQEYREDGDFVNTYMLVEVLSDLLDPSDVIIPGSSGSCSEITSQAFQVKEGQRIFNTPGLGSMGFGLPASIGACLASGRKRTISIIGDGGLQHNIQELETLARLRLPVKVLVLNNRGYASIRAAQRSHFKGRLVGCDATCGLTLPDTCKIAGAYGLPTERISRNGEVREMLDKVLRSDGPLVCEVMVDPDLITAPRLSSSLRPDGTIVSKPLEDLWPFLEREELQRNMIVPLPEE
jgi:acetolactate synthase-1/2/3 large subunit